ncbi:MAG: TIM barrel protein, partial [bacterium]
KNLEIPFIIHAAHSAKGLNLAKKEFLNNNLKLAQEAFKFADDLKAETVIFHPGIEGDIKETVRQLKKIKDPRIIVENKPYYGIYDNVICNGNSPEEIKFVIDETGIGFCLDLGHAIYSANAQKIDPFFYIEEFLKLKPKMFHISDGDMNGVYDEHKNIGKGSFDLRQILNLIPNDSMISVETNKNYEDSLKDFEQDIANLKKIEKG